MEPFTFDEDQDRMTLSEALHLAEDHETNLNVLENDMTDTKKSAAKKTVPSTPAAAAAAAKKTVKKVTPKAEVKPEKKVGAKPGPRAVPEGFVSLAMLAEELKMEPSALRRKLRGLELVKPEGHGWAWKDGSKDLAAVRKALAKSE